MADRFDQATSPNRADTGAAHSHRAGPSGLLTARAAAEWLGVSERTIRRAIARGDLPATKYAGSFRIAPDALDQYAARIGGGIQRDKRPDDAPAISPAPPPVIVPGRLTLLPPVLPRPLTRLVGREQEGAQAAVRLLVLTGPGGVGKTRLALKVAADLEAGVAGGVWFIPLAAIADPDLVLRTIARAVGVRDVGGRPLVERLAASLRGEPSLLVLDNFEQVLAAASQVVELIAACPDLKVLVTSRARLRVSGEHVFPVPPLSLPGVADPVKVDGLAGSEALRLFVDRAQAADPGFALTPDTAPTIAEICHRLDGLPLAVELAAARTTVFPPAALLARLERRLPLLTEGPRDAPNRLRTMRDAIAWGYDLLSPADQVLFQSLSVFAGGFDLVAADAVAAATEESARDAMEGISSLVEKSLLRRELGPGGEPRFLMLETIREFAAEKLAASGNEFPIRTAHRDYFLALAEEAERGLVGREQVTWQRRLDADHANLRSALTWASEHDPMSALRLATALWRFWWAHPTEGLGWLGRAPLRSPEAAPSLRTKALGAASILASFCGDAGRGESLAREAIDLAQGSGNEAARVWGTLMLSFADRCRGDHAAAATNAEAAASGARGLEGGGWLAFLPAVALNRVGHEAYEQGDWQRATTVLEEALGRWRDLGYPWGIGMALAKLADVAQARGASLRAAALYRESLVFWDVLEHELSAVEVLTGLARLATRRQPERAIRLFAAVESLQIRVGLVPPRVLRAQAEASLASARTALGNARYAAAWTAGQALSTNEIVEEARAIATECGTPGRETFTSRPACSPTHLTQREMEVLRLVAAGRTDRQIADALFLSPRTVQHHVANLLGKLGSGTRTGAVTAAQSAGLLPPTP